VTQSGAFAPELCCPACGGALSADAKAYRCLACDRAFPILYGIADFRLAADAYLSLEEEREKAGRLDAFGKTHSFDELLTYYYAITDDVPPRLASIYAAYARCGPERADPILDDLACAADTRLLDLGCGSGGLVVAARRRGLEAVGVDVALRWLVVCRKRLAELGLETTLICAAAERLPFKPGAFTTVIAADLLENTADPQAVLACAARQLRSGGVLWLSSNNRRWLGFPAQHLADLTWPSGAGVRGGRPRGRGAPCVAGRLANRARPPRVLRLCDQPLPASG
jgi:SAM-dependent methyltransferase